MRLVCLSDQHGWLCPVPEGDVLAIAGDVCVHRNPARAAAYLDTEFRRWLDRQAARFDHVLFVPGNHDELFELHPGLVPDLPWTVLVDQGVTVDGVRFWGTPYTPRFGGWGFMMAEADLELPYSLIPQGVDVLVSHGPPRGVGDVTRGEAVGSTALRNAVSRARPRLHVFGHIHEGRGVYPDAYGPGTLAANVAVVNERYEPAGPPFVFEKTADGWG